MNRTLGAALICVAMLAATARAELKVGDAPKELGSEARFVVGDEVDFTVLRGKVVILQLAHTKSDPSKEQVKVLQELNAKLGEKGLRILVVFEESKFAVKKFIAATGADYPIVAEVRDLRTRWGLQQGFPTTYVLDVRGKVAWAGNFADRAEVEIQRLLEDVNDRPWLPEKYAPISKAMEGDDFGAARTGLVEALAKEGVPRDDRKRLRAALAWINKHAKRAFAKPDEHRAKGNHYDAYRAYAEVAKKHPGSDAARRAGEARDALMADKKIKRQIDAWKFYETQFEEAKRLELTNKKKAISALKKVVSRYRGTKAAAKAQYWVDKLKE